MKEAKGERAKRGRGRRRDKNQKGSPYNDAIHLSSIVYVDSP